MLTLCKNALKRNLHGTLAAIQMNNKTRLLAIFTLVLIGCTQSIDSDKIKRKDGQYINSETGELLNGKYKNIEPIGGTYGGNHESTFEYDDGIPVGKYTYTFNGAPIYSGRYLDENELKEKINSLTKSKRVDLNLWEEGGCWMLDVELLYPGNKDSVVIKNVVDMTNTALLGKHNYKSIHVLAANDSIKEKVYWEKVK